MKKIIVQSSNKWPLGINFSPKNYPTYPKKKEEEEEEEEEEEDDDRDDQEED